MDIILTLHQAIPAPTQPGEIPEWLQLLPAGVFFGDDGRGPYKTEDAAAVIAASMASASGKIPLDENHSTDLAAPKGLPSPARGWITAMEEREDGVWGRVAWTKTGEALMAEKAYCGISPVIMSRKDGTVLRILRAALTNDPNLPLKSLHQKGKTMDEDTLQALRLACNLPEADGAALLAHVKSLAEAKTAKTEPAKPADPANANSDADANPASPDLHARQADAIKSLQSKIAELETNEKRSKAVAFIDGAIRDGKPVLALRSHYIERHMKDAASVEKELAALISLHSGSATGAAAPQGDHLTDDEETVISLMGLSRDEYLKSRKNRTVGAL